LVNEGGSGSSSSKEALLFPSIQRRSIKLS